MKIRSIYKIQKLKLFLYILILEGDISFHGNQLHYEVLVFLVYNKYEISLYSVAMALLHLLYEGNAGRSVVQGHNNICIR